MKRFVILFFALAMVCLSCQNGGTVSDAVDSEVQTFTSFEDFAGHSIAVTTGTTQDMLFSSISGVEVIRFNSLPEMILSVQSGVAEFLSTDKSLLVGRDIADDGLQEAYSVEQPNVRTSVAFNKKEGALCDEFNDFLRELKANGIYDDMIMRWTEPGAQIQDLPEIEMPAAPRRKLVIAVDPCSFPFSFIKGDNLCGFEIEMMNRFGASRNYGIEYLQITFTGLIAAISTGKVDCAINVLTPTEEREKQMLFSESYYPSVVMVAGALQKNNTADTGVFDSTSLWQKIKEAFHNNMIVENRWKLILEGLWETLVISFFSLIFGTLIGALLCWMQFRRSRISRKFVDLYIMLVQGIPMLVFLMFMFYVVFASSRLTATWVAIVAFSLNFAAFVCELFIAGIKGVDAGQTEAGRALGFSGVATFFRIVAPQALRTIIPMYKGEIISMVKNTSIVGYIAIQDLTKMSDLIRSRTFDAFFPLILISIIYFILAWLIGLLLDRLGKATSPKTK